jgi:hypothetical protein
MSSNMYNMDPKPKHVSCSTDCIINYGGNIMLTVYPWSRVFLKLSYSAWSWYWVNDWFLTGRRQVCSRYEIETKKVYTWCFLRSYQVGTGQKAGIPSSHTGLYEIVLGTNVECVDIKPKPMIKTSVDSNQCLVGKNCQIWLLTKPTQ